MMNPKRFTFDDTSRNQDQHKKILYTECMIIFCLVSIHVRSIITSCFVAMHTSDYSYQLLHLCTLCVQYHSFNCAKAVSCLARQ